MINQVPQHAGNQAPQVGLGGPPGAPQGQPAPNAYITPSVPLTAVNDELTGKQGMMLEAAGQQGMQAGAQAGYQQANAEQAQAAAQEQLQGQMMQAAQAIASGQLDPAMVMQMAQQEAQQGNPAAIQEAQQVIAMAQQMAQQGQPGQRGLV